MSEKEFIVSLKKGVDYDAFNQEMIASTGAGDIPGRSVDVANARSASARNTHYALTDAEVENLKNDSRVADIAIPPDQDSSIEIGMNTRYSGTFYKGTADSGQVIDWGKRRHSITTETATWYPSLVGSYDYSLDGTGVDVVIQDSGLQVDHPEFAGRVHQIDWYTESGVSGSLNANHYRDFDGHGTHCAGTAAGKTFGWAKGAQVYAVKVNGLEGSGDSGTGIPISDCFDVIKLWHRNKPLDPITGLKRPTIVNMSWGYSTGSASIQNVVYRGTQFNSDGSGGATADGSFSAIPNTHMRDTYGIYPYFSNGQYRAPVRVTSVDTDLQELIDEGVHVTIAAGNNSFKVDLDSGDDYNNRISVGGVTKYYHRGSSPYDTEAFMVGSLLSENSTIDKKVGFSTTGPGIDIYAAGDEITSSTSTTNRFADADYWGDSNFKQCNINGTSMAAPQVCGLGAMYLQANPMLTPAQLKSMIHKDSSETLLAGTLTGYGSLDNAMGGPTRVLVSRYTNRTPFSNTLSGKYSIKGR